MPQQYGGMFGWGPSAPQMGALNHPIAAAPAQPRPQAPAPAQKKPGFLESGILGDLGMALLANSGQGGNWGQALGMFGSSWQQRQAMAEKERRSQADMERRRGILAQAGYSPDQILAAEMNPDKFAESMAKGIEPANIGAGDSRMTRPGQPLITAPKMGIENSTAYTQTPEGINIGQRLAPDYGDENSAHQNAETRRHNLATEGIDRLKAKTEAGNADKPDFGNENGLRNQYLGQAKGFQDVRDAASRVRALSVDMNPAEQMGLVFAVMKTLDPASTVRESEYANAQNTTGAFGQLWNMWNKAKDGKFLDATQIANFKKLVGEQYNAAERNYGRTYDHYRGLAGRYRMDPNIIQDFRLDPEVAQLLQEAQDEEAGAAPAQLPPPAKRGFGMWSGRSGSPRAPAGWDPEDWKFLTPEEQAQALGR